MNWHFSTVDAHMKAILKPTVIVLNFFFIFHDFIFLLDLLIFKLKLTSVLVFFPRSFIYILCLGCPERMLSVIMYFHWRRRPQLDLLERCLTYSLSLIEQKMIVSLNLCYLLYIFLSYWKQHLRILKKVWDLS